MFAPGVNICQVATKLPRNVRANRQEYL